MNEDKERRTPKKARGNHDIKKYITCKRWKEEAEEEEKNRERGKAVSQAGGREERHGAKENHKLPGGSRLDTTLAVPVSILEGGEKEEGDEQNHILPGGSSRYSSDFIWKSSKMK